ncbi:putative ABC-type dipeptide transport system, periplasmic component [Cupriavidus taiwanensis]|uniref:ABC-type dipeptide transport system, periplasmic component n=2 Tax=Cupriavidus taiwanensis TaxID=164546 RepID=A0A375BGI8_9BURK|nr:putative ABC-type dipeptide transport system, periplasmic component [Cupriavidus taiwanensis]
MYREANHPTMPSPAATLASRLAAAVLASLTAAALLAGANAARAADLRIGYKAEISAADPHVLDAAGRNLWGHVYETLVGLDNALRPVPLLATAWRQLDDRTWEFQLRAGVRFSNGEPFTAEDARYSIERAIKLPGARTFRTYLKSVAAVEVTGPLALRVRTRSPNPVLPQNVGMVAMLPRSLGANVREADFAHGSAAIGTGPYRLVAWEHGQQLTLSRNPDYWGGPQPWQRVVFQFIPKEPARASALLSGLVDVIDASSASIAEAFARTSGRIRIVSATSYMLNYLQLDQARAVSPYVQDHAGQPLAANPLRDVRVRQAISLAIDRDLIAARVTKGDSVPAGQMVPQGFFGFAPAVPAPRANVERARWLLAQAGYPQGFRLTLHCPNDRYLNDAKTCEAVGQMLTRAGIRTEVRTLPYSVYITRATSGGAGGKPEFSAFLLGIGAVSGDSLEPLVAVAHAQDKAAGLGANNRSGYANAAVDDLIEQAMRTMAPAPRELAQRDAAQRLAADAGIVPLHHLRAAWAYRDGLAVQPRSDGFTYAGNIRPAPPALPQR